MRNTQERQAQVTSSMLWAAWADAVGFISELTDEAGLRRRLAGHTLSGPRAWTRRIGGKFGVDVSLPAGCYSDDTQLRLAVSRAIGPRGFDVEAFARVELTVWPSYALGGGRATKKAVANLAKPQTLWSSNFYQGWHEAGGNGVAMRIQPHVWAARDAAEVGTHLLDVVHDGVTTHGHPRALVGAVLHAVALGVTLDTGGVPDAPVWAELLDMTARVGKMVLSDSALDVWRKRWESLNGASFDDAWGAVVSECAAMIDTAMPGYRALQDAVAGDADPAGAYLRVVDALNLRTEEARGSGTATAVAALLIASAYGRLPREASLLSARAIGTDTDTIGTMAAALVGAATVERRPRPVLDDGYLQAEAQRLAAIATGAPAATFRYPDLLGWVPPKTQMDAVGQAGDVVALAGIAMLEPVHTSEPVESRDAVWRWMTSNFGASFLVKQRRSLPTLPPTAWPVASSPPAATTRRPRGGESADDQLPLGDTAPVTAASRHDRPVGLVDLPREPSREHRAPTGPVDVDAGLAWVDARGYPDEAIGYMVRQFAERGTVEQMIAFTAAVRVALQRRGRHT